MSISGPIQRGIPIPKQYRGRPTLYIIADMKPGDSRFFAASPDRVRPSVWPRAKALGFALRTAAEGDGTRVWRVA